MMRAENPWLARRPGTVKARVRLFCLPYAGGSASAYRQFQAALAPHAEVCPIELPGRGTRFRDPAARDLSSLVDSLLEVLETHLADPYALFGYSMGALIAFELARKATALLGRTPEHLFVAARGAPHTHKPVERLSELADEALLAEIQRRYRAIPEILLSDREMRTIIVGLMRADLSLVESYSYRPGITLTCPLTVFGGDRDPAVRASDLEGWRPLTTGMFRAETFAGDHFFLEPQREPLLRAVKRELTRRDQPARAVLEPATSRTRTF